ncbi:nucleotidyltransferase family protein [Frigidibacter sp. MR17.24]|uniref:nucleotidyltransferase family protein n=1 Tax=Frigidibacter sp. MR17.24 TaxID=3127345 RepID=UPI003FA53EAA
MTGAASVLICAAGAASRMRGGDKILEPVAGVPLLARLAAAARASGAVVRVTLPPAGALRHDRRAAALAGLGVVTLPVADADEGMAASLRAGARAARAAGEDGLLVVLGDMPEIEAGDIAALLAAAAAAPGRVIRAATATGRAGHPVLFPARLLPALERLRGDRGAREVLAGEAAELVALAGERAVTDLDTPEDWARWRAATGG